jgi:putative endonuclease
MPCIAIAAVCGHGVLRLRECFALRSILSAQDDRVGWTVKTEHKYFVYIVCSLSGTLYIGVTNSIYRRALEHKRGEVEGFASKYHCDRMVYYESFDDVQKAIAREKQLKGWRRSKKIALIESKNPRWEDLAEKWGAQMLFAGESIKGR